MKIDGDNLKKMRRSLAHSQGDLGELLGVSARTVRNWEKNETTPKAYFIKKMKSIYKRLKVTDVSI